MAMRTPMKPLPRLLLLGAALALLLCAGVAVAERNDDAAMNALFARLREVQSGGEGGLGELEKFNSDAPVAQDVVTGDGDSREEVPLEPDAAADLFAHIYEMQRKALEGAAEGGDKEEFEVEEEEEKQQVEEVGVQDPQAQERFKELEAALKGLTKKVVDFPEENDLHNMQLNAPGLKGDDVIDLLQKYALEMHEKIHRNGAGLESHQEDGQDGEIGHVHGGDHDDHEHDHGHGHGHHEHGHGHGHKHEHDYDHGHHHHGHGDGDAHANVGFSRASDAQYHSHDHSGHSHGHDHGDSIKKKKFILPEEIAEEEDLLQYGFEGQMYSSAEQPSRWSGPELGVWLRAMGCSLLVSLASLICLMLLPCIVSNGKPSETVVNALAAFGAGAMLGDAFLHQLPHAFGNSGSSPHSHDAHHHDHGHSHSHSHDHDHSSAAGHGHSHSLKDLSIGLAVLGGILLFFIVEKIVRRYEELSSHGGQLSLGHTHHHHQKKDTAKKLGITEKTASVEEVSAIEDQGSKSLETNTSDMKKRKSGKKKDSAAVGKEVSSTPVQPPKQVEASGGFVIGYLNLFSDAVHNFTDGMALGSAFLLHGTVGGWSRTLFLLAHELPQEVGDFGILVKSGFSVFEALAFNFLSALVALAGTAVALMLGGNTGHSSLMEGFIAGGFIYMSVGGVMPSMHDQGSSLKSTLAQLVPMVLGMGVAVVISLAEKVSLNATYDMKSSWYIEDLLDDISLKEEGLG